jgi:hypothetical protein
LNAGTQQTPQQWPKPGSLVAPYLWSLALPVAWGFSLVGLSILALVVRFTSADSSYDSNQDVGLGVSVLIQGIGGLAVLATFIALAWVKGRRAPEARLRFLGYATIALAGCTVLALLAFFLLPDGSA